MPKSHISIIKVFSTLVSMVTNCGMFNIRVIYHYAAFASSFIIAINNMLLIFRMITTHETSW